MTGDADRDSVAGWAGLRIVWCIERGSLAAASLVCRDFGVSPRRRTVERWEREGSAHQKAWAALARAGIVPCRVNHGDGQAFR